MTKTDQIVNALLARGFVEIQSRSGKYREFVKDGKENHYFVGSHGALRVGHCASQSRSLEHIVPSLLNHLTLTTGR